MADKAIGELPQAQQVQDDSKLPIEQQGKAMHMTGAQFADFAKNVVRAYVEGAAESARRAAAEADEAAEYAAAAEQTANTLEIRVKQDAGRAEAARDSIILDEEKIASAVDEAEDHAQNAAGSEESAAESAQAAEEAANRAQAEADRATIPAAQGIYNFVLTDRVTAERYALVVESGKLKLLGVAETVDAMNMTLIDVSTGVSYELISEDGKLKLLEV